MSHLPPNSSAPLTEPSSAASPPASGLAVAALVLGILGIITCIPLLAIPALICGIMALNQIGASAGTLGGRGMAIWGVVLGGIGSVLWVIVIIGALMLGMLLPALGAARQNAMRMENSTHIRGIHQALMTHANGHRDRMPGLDTAGNLVGATAAERYQIMLDEKLFSPEYVISPFDRTGKQPWTGGRVTPTNFSYAMLEIATPGARRDEWRGTKVNANAAMVSDRNTGTDAGPNVQSVHTTVSGKWEGSVVFNDNHVAYWSSHVSGPTRYGQATPTDPDNLFLDERAGDDAYMVADAP